MCYNFVVLAIFIKESLAVDIILELLKFSAGQWSDLGWE